MHGPSKLGHCRQLDVRGSPAGLAPPSRLDRRGEDQEALLRARGGHVAAMGESAATSYQSVELNRRIRRTQHCICMILSVKQYLDRLEVKHFAPALSATLPTVLPVAYVPASKVQQLCRCTG